MGASVKHNPQQKDDRIEDTLGEIEERTGLETDFDDIEFTELPEEIPARTRYEPDKYGVGQGKTTLVLDEENISRFDELTLDNALTHEVLEKHQFEGDLGDKLRREHGISDELVEKIGEVQRNAPNSKREGMTQKLANQLSEGGELAGRYFYPYETQLFEEELDQEGFDLDEEILEDGEAVSEPRYQAEEPMAVNQQVYAASFGEDFYVEAGRIGDFEYQFWVIGEAAGKYAERLEEEFDEQNYGDFFEQYAGGWNGEGEEIETSGEEESYFEREAMNKFRDYWEEMEEELDGQEYSDDGYSRGYREPDKVPGLEPDIENDPAPVSVIDPAGC